MKWTIYIYVYISIYAMFKELKYNGIGKLKFNQISLKIATIKEKNAFADLWLELH